MNDSDETAKHDFELARQNYHELIIKGQDALDEMIEVARASEHPRAFEVLSTLMKSVADVNGDLLALHRKKKDYTKRTCYRNCVDYASRLDEKYTRSSGS